MTDEAGPATPFGVETIHVDLPAVAGAFTRRLHDAGLPVTAARAADLAQALAVQVANAVSRMRDSDVQKPPGIAEAIDWLAALNLLGVEALDAAAVDRTLGSVLKYEEDQDAVRAEGLEHLVGSGD